MSSKAIRNFADSVTLLTGNVGDDVMIHTREGLDTVIIRSVGVNDDLLIDTASGNDRLTISDSEADELLALLGGDNDTVSLTNVSGHRATLNGGSGVDTLAASNVAFDEFFSASSF
jgi:Ca2+-binding RTX toxin-like protein